MNKLLRSLIIITIIISGALISHGVVYVDNNSGDYKADVDKFIPQKKTEFTPSELANKLEQTMQKANSGFDNTNNNKSTNKIIKKNTKTNYRKTYKWF